MAETVAEQLFADAPVFEFFQAVRLLERLYRDRRPIGADALPHQEIVRIRAHLSLAFPPSALYTIEPPTDERPYALMTQTFMGLTGPSGVLPRHYTQLLLDLNRDARGPERRALGDWFALFDHRLASLFYRAWDKYRFYRAYERGEAFTREPDPFTQTVLSLLGLGTPNLRDRLRVVSRGLDPTRPLRAVDDLALFHTAGLLALQTRSAHGLELFLRDYWQIPVEVRCFQGQWLRIESTDQTCLGRWGRLGIDAVAGERIWDVSSRFRLRLGPLDRTSFEQFLPDCSAQPERKSIFVLAQLTRLYCGPEFDFDVQLVLQAADVPECAIGGQGFGARLGWNTWLISHPSAEDRDDAVFLADDVPWIDAVRGPWP